MANNIAVLTVPPNATVDKKFDIMLSLLVKQSKMMRASEVKITALEEDSKKMLSTIANLNREVNQALSTTRAAAVPLPLRLFGLAVAEDESS
jgi:hypothetical protein